VLELSTAGDVIDLRGIAFQAGATVS